ncbi:YqhG family protein [Priestia koreensis]|uniref:YqhG family protein n=1 Tax=Priestia koreensis TaxID=284581 RepID=UPI0028F71DF8|nr:YqhG family protein [Priestia koreensis]
MQQTDIHQFLKQYFTANDCEISENHPGYFTVQLNVDMDKELMNRPFYWHYLEATGGEPNPMSITFITDPNVDPSEVKGERIHFGSPRLHQIFESTKKFGRFIRLYEQVHVQHNTALHPWLGLNVRISYQCDRKRDELLSLGLHLISGKIVEGFHEKAEQMTLSPGISDYCFTLSPLIKPQSGLFRLKQFVQHQIEQQDHMWAAEARERWNSDLALLDHFYEELDEKPESYLTEKTALQEQYEPNIHVGIVNGGLFYLSENTMQRL